MTGITLNKKNISSILLTIFLFVGVISLAQDAPTFKQHETIELNDGLKIEILKCFNQKGNDYCDIIIYKQKRQLGKRKILTTKILSELRASQTVDSINIIPEMQAARKYVDSLFMAKDTALKPLRNITRPTIIINKSVKDTFTNQLPVTVTNPEIKYDQQQTTIIKKDTIKITKPIQALKTPQYNQIIVAPTGYSLDQCYKIGLAQNIKLNNPANN